MKPYNIKGTLCQIVAGQSLHGMWLLSRWQNLADPSHILTVYLTLKLVRAS